MDKVAYTAKHWSVVDARDSSPEEKNEASISWRLGVLARPMMVTGGSVSTGSMAGSGAGSGARLMSSSSVTPCGTPPGEGLELAERLVQVATPRARIDHWMTRRISEIAALLEAASPEPGEPARLDTRAVESLEKLKQGFLSRDGQDPMSPALRDAALRVLVRSYELLARLEREHPVAGALFPHLLRNLCSALELHKHPDHLQAVLDAIPGGDALEGLPARSPLPSDMLQGVFGPWFGPMEGAARQAFIDRVAARLVRAPAAEQTASWLTSTVGMVARCVNLGSRLAGTVARWDSLDTFVRSLREMPPARVEAVTIGLMWGMRPLGGSQDDEDSLRLGLRRIILVLRHPDQFTAVGAGLRAWLARPGMPDTAREAVRQALRPIFTTMGQRLPFATAITCAVNLVAGLGDAPDGADQADGKRARQQVRQPVR